jgi:fermentation-respiration switch protein FrsA (DUF1100 family)
MTRRDIEFDAEGVILRGWFYTANSDAGTAPVIVMAHGLSAVKEMYLDDYAEHFSETGLHVLVFDHRNFGASDGEPRQEIDPVAQTRDYRHAITYAKTLPEVDGEKIGIWGSSFSGGHVQVVAAYDKRVRAAVAQVPFVSGYGNVRALVRADLLPGFRTQFEADREARFQGGAPGMVPVVDPDPLASVMLPSAEAWEWFNRARKERAPTWRNEITLRSVERVGEYEPKDVIWQISPTPFLMIVGEDDTVCPQDMALAAYEQALEPKELVMIPGGHFDAYQGEGFRLSAGAARDFFVRKLIGS